MSGSCPDRDVNRDAIQRARQAFRRILQGCGTRRQVGAEDVEYRALGDAIIRQAGRDIAIIVGQPANDWALRPCRRGERNTHGESSETAFHLFLRKGEAARLSTWHYMPGNA